MFGFRTSGKRRKFLNTIVPRTDVLGNWFVLVSNSFFDFLVSFQKHLEQIPKSLKKKLKCYGNTYILFRLSHTHTQVNVDECSLYTSVKLKIKKIKKYIPITFEVIFDGIHTESSSESNSPSFLSSSIRPISSIYILFMMSDYLDKKIDLINLSNQTIIFFLYFLDGKIRRRW